MKYLLLSQNIKMAEAAFNEANPNGYEILMRRAANALFCEASKFLINKNKKTAVLCGSGNNGGDGWALAKLLKDAGFFVTVIKVFEPKSELCIKMSKEYDGNVLLVNDTNLNDFDLLVDAVFGTGFKGKVQNEIKLLFNNYNNSSAKKIAVDIPSGLYADDLKVSNDVLKADLCVTFCAYKKCQLLFPAAEYAYETVLYDLDIGNKILEEAGFAARVLNNFKIPKRKRNTHKGTYGTTLHVCGNYGYAGAAILAARSALKSGVGIAKIVLPESIYLPVTEAVPEAVCLPFPTFRKLLPNEIKEADSVLIGCGLAKDSYAAEMLKTVVDFAKSTVIIDADGLNMIASSIDIIKDLKAELIITPHPGEAARLLKVSIADIEYNREFYAKELAKKFSATVVLKGAVTVIADKNGELYFNTSGNAGMATGGSGDTLAGIISAFCAAGETPLNAALCGVYIHGLAGDIAKCRVGEISLLPEDITNALPQAFKMCGE